MKTILIIHPSLGLGGAEKIIAFLANGLSSTYDINLLLLENIPQTLEMDNSINIIIKDCYYNAPIMGKNLIRGLREFNKMTKQIMNTILEIKPDLVIAFELRTALSLSIIKRKMDVKILFSERADPYEHSKVWSYMLKKAYKLFDHVVFQTEAARRYYGDIVNEKCSIIANPAFKRNLTVADNYKYPKEYMFSAGRLQYRKGFDISIKAFCIIAEKFPDIDYLIFGQGEEKERLEKLIADYNMKDRIIIKDPINNIVDINKNARLFIMPSRSEGIPNILLEAIMESIPCVASDCSPGGARMLSDNGRYFRLAENNNPESLALEIEDALSNEKKTISMCMDARKSMLRFNADNILNEWLNILNNLLENTL